jgi:hypothetical protein
MEDRRYPPGTAIVKVTIPIIVQRVIPRTGHDAPIIPHEDFAT